MNTTFATRSRRRRAKSAGYSLVEVLITLVIMAMLTGLLFQGIGGAAQISLKLSDEADRLDRTALAADWWRSSIASALPPPEDPSDPDAPRPATFVGGSESLAIETVASLHARLGAPRKARWSLEREGATTRLVYQGDNLRWIVAQTRGTNARFVYFGDNGASSPQWTQADPPRLVVLEGFFDTPVIAHPRSRAVAFQPPERPNVGL